MEGRTAALDSALQSRSKRLNALDCNEFRSSRSSVMLGSGVAAVSELAETSSSKLFCNRDSNALHIYITQLSYFPFPGAPLSFKEPLLGMAQPLGRQVVHCD